MTESAGTTKKTGSRSFSRRKAGTTTKGTKKPKTPSEEATSQVVQPKAPRRVKITRSRRKRMSVRNALKKLGHRQPILPEGHGGLKALQKAQRTQERVTTHTMIDITGTVAATLAREGHTPTSHFSFPMDRKKRRRSAA